MCSNEDLVQPKKLIKRKKTQTKLRSQEKISSQYDEDYFKTSALVIIEITKNSGSYKLTMSSVKIVDGSMIVKFKSSKPNIVTHDMAYWHIVVECTQEELLEFSSVQVYDNNNKVEVRE